MATPSDLNVLLDMGFEKERAEIAVKQTGGLQGALQWLEDNQDKSLEEITAPTTKDSETDPNAEPPALKEGEVAKSMVCEDCGKRFRSVAQAEFHASKTDHMNFSESTEEIAPLTEEEKKQRLQELRVALEEKRAKQALIDKEEQKKNEKIRMKATREAQDIKEDLEKKERIREAEAKRREKLADVAAKKRIQEKIAADKEERRLKAAREKAGREGRAPPPDPSIVAAVAAAPSTPKPAAAHTETRLRLQTASGNVQKTFPVHTTLFEVAQALEGEGQGPITSFSTTFPKKTFTGSIDFAKTLKEADLVPSAVLIAK
ncbi:hypothetical protein B7463_g11015, partial [Scytalidium lignicola]